MLCNDPLINFLKDDGYNVVRLPRVDIHPLQILCQQGRDFRNLGEITTLLVTGPAVPAPQITENQAVANISGKRTSDLSIGLGLSILSSIISTLGGSKLGLDLTYKRARSISFEFRDVFEDKIEIAQLDQCLADADISPYSRYVADLLEADELYVINTTIKSRKITVEAKKSDNVALTVDIPAIQGALGGNVKVSGQGEKSSIVTYEGNVPLVFGFQAVQLFFDRGHYTTLRPVEAGRAMHKGLSREGRTSLGSEGPFIRLQS